MKKSIKIISIILGIVIFGYIIYIYIVTPETKKIIIRKIETQKTETNYKKEVKNLSKEYVEPVLEEITKKEEKLKKEKEIIKKYFDVLEGKIEGDIYAYMNVIEEIGKKLETDEEKKLVYPVLIDIYMGSDRFDGVKRLENELEKMGVKLNKINSESKNEGGKK